MFYFVHRIDSEHNRRVVESIVKEIGTESFTSRQIRGEVTVCVCVCVSRNWGGDLEALLVYGGVVPLYN